MARGPAAVKFLITELWPETVASAELLTSLIAAIRAHVAMTEPAALTVALWALHSHALAAFAATPRLVIRSAQPASGKTTLLSVLAHLVPRALDICAGTPAAIVWSLSYRPTLVIDDASALLTGSKDVRAIIRNGSQRSGAHLLRIADYYTQNVDLFTAAAIAIEGPLPRVLSGRSIEILLDRLKPGETVSRLSAENTGPLIQLKRMMARWAADRIAELRQAQAAVQPCGDENWRPLLAIAADAGAQWETRARAAMQRNRLDSQPSILELLLTDIRALLEERATGELQIPAPNGKYMAGRDRIRSADLARLLGTLEGQPWCEWGKSAQPINPHALAKLLAPAGVRPIRLRFHTGDQNGPGADLTDRGYLDAQFAEAFARYLPQAATAEAA